jgi:uncharacterized membrane protein YebE (DUF533 family)
MFGWLKRAIKGPAAFERDEQWVLAGLLFAASQVGAASNDEPVDIEGIADRIEPVCPVERERLVDLLADHAGGLISPKKAGKYAARVCAFAPKDWHARAAALVRAADVLCAARGGFGAQRRFLNRLGRALKLPEPARRSVIDVMRKKHAFDLTAPKPRKALLQPRSVKLAPGEPEWGSGQCMLALVIGAAYCDGSISLSEEAGLRALVRRSGAISQILLDAELMGDSPEARTSSESLPARIQSFLDGSFRPMLNFRGMHAIVQKCCRTLPRNKALSHMLYALACEVVLADRDLHPAEERFIHDLGAALKLPIKDRQKIRRVIAWKHKNGLLSLADAVRR